jgi:hypothetical protein
VLVIFQFVFVFVLQWLHQAGIIDVFPDDEVKCAHDNNTVGDVRLNLNVKGTK